MELPLAQRADPTLEYQLVPPEASQDRFIVFAARVLALAATAAALYPLALAAARLFGIRENYYGFTTVYTAYGRPQSGLVLAFSAVGWLNGAAAAIVVITAIGTFVRRNAMRIGLASSLCMLGLGLLTEAILRDWNLLQLLATRNSRAHVLEVALTALPGFAPLIFPLAGGAILWHRAFRRISFTESDLLPGGAQALCFIGIVIAGLGLIFRPLALLSVLGAASTERAPLGLPFLTHSDSLIGVWHVLTRIALFGCSVMLLIGSIMLTRGNIHGRKLLLRQAVIAVVINTVEAVLIVMMMYQVSDMIIAISGAVQHLVFIVPGLALDIALYAYFSRPQTQKALLARLKPA